MKRYASMVVGVLLGFVLVPGTVAAADRNFHGTDTGTWVEDDFCGTGVPVEHAFTNTFTFHAFQSTFRGEDVMTNLENGDSIVGSFAGLGRGQFSSGDPDGIHTVTFTHAGLQEMIQTSHGPVLTMDVGYVVSVVTFNGDQFVSEQNVWHGPHPELASDFAHFCEVAVPALGIG